MTVGYKVRHSELTENVEPESKVYLWVRVYLTFIMAFVSHS